MNNDRKKSAEAKPKPSPTPPAGAKAVATSAPAAAAAGGPAGHVPPLFRKIDWLTFAVVTLIVFFGYLFSLAPNLSLEDSGELAVGSMYAGVPHPPGYPVWTIYTWAFCKLVPISNIAYRVALSSAVAGAFACGLLAFMVSRGSSMMMEGIAELKNIERRWENLICMVSGFVAGMVLGFNGYMWSQAVIVEVYAISVLSLMGVMICLMRWIYAPHQRRYLYWAMFLFGICITNHQSLLVAAMGIEVAILAAQPRLGRDFAFINSVCYIVGLILKASGKIPTFNAAPGQFNMMFVIFNVVGISSLGAAAWLTIKTQQILTEWKPVLISGLVFALGAAFYFYMPLAGMSNPPMQWGYPRTIEGFIHALTRGQYEKTNPTDIINDPFRFLMQMGMVFEGVVDEFNWVCTFLALVPIFFFARMQRRERAWLVGIWAIYFCLAALLMTMLNPSPDRQSRELVRVFFTASHIMVAILAGYGLTLICASLATHYDHFRSSGILGGVAALDFALFTLVVASLGMLGDPTKAENAPLYGLWKVVFWGAATACAALARREALQKEAKLLRWISVPFIAISFGLTVAMMMGNKLDAAGVNEFFHTLALSFNKDQYALPVHAGLLLVGVTVVFLLALILRKSKPPVGLALILFAAMPAHSVMTHWFENEQRGHLFGYWFGHDMFTPPFGIYPPMARDAVLYGGTDPGRFCPTYTIFCESFIPREKKMDTDPDYDRRDVYIITQNALADHTYLMYIRAHYNKSDQVKYDSPFWQELFRGRKERDVNYRTNFVARLAYRLLDKPFLALGDYIEKQRRTGESRFQESDFLDLPGLVLKLKPGGNTDLVSRYLYDNLAKPTQDLISSDGGDPARLKKLLAQDLNVLLERELVNSSRLKQLRAERDAVQGELDVNSASEKLTQRKADLDKEMATLEKVGPLYDAERFKGVELKPTTKQFVAQNPQLHTRLRLNRLLLEEAYPKLIATSPGGLYPDREILIATPQDSEVCFREYLDDAQRRATMNPPQLKPGEDVKIVDNKVQVSGQVAVMAINGLLTKVMFDKNPGHEFYVEESFPLDWMYPHLTPFGIIMKINRQKLPELTDEICRNDREFWTRFSRERLIGDVVKSNTTVREIADFVEKVYLQRDFAGYAGDRKFIRDDQAQKAFSKLRSSIGGVYAWRIGECSRKLMEWQARPPAVRQAQNAEYQRLLAEQQRMVAEADFTFRQAFAFCPYSPEAVFRYAQLLINLGRLDDALIVAETCMKLDPYNGQVSVLVKNLRDSRRPAGGQTQSPNTLEKLESEYAAQPQNLQAGFNLASAYMQLQQPDRAAAVVDRIVNDPKADAAAYRAALQAYVSLNNPAKIQDLLTRLEARAKADPNDLIAAVGVVEACRDLNQRDKALAALDQLVNRTNVDARSMLDAAQIVVSLSDLPRLEIILDKLVRLSPGSPEAWFDLAAVKATLAKTNESLSALRTALNLDAQRRAADPRASSILNEALKDDRFISVRNTPEFKQLVSAKR